MGQQANSRTDETSETASERAKENTVYRADGKRVGEIERHTIDRITDEIATGLLIYRVFNGPEILLTHPGGPYWSRNDEGTWSIPTWSIPKGMAEADDIASCARREFAKETGLLGNGEYIALEPVEEKSGKILHGFALEADLNLKNFHSNEFSLEWPPCSGRWQTFPEIDRIDYFSLRTALRRILPHQWPLLLELSEKLGWRIRRTGCRQLLGKEAGSRR
jgi:predicted NUDIX family NTP pyrophosphohydrolase